MKRNKIKTSPVKKKTKRRKVLVIAVVALAVVLVAALGFFARDMFTAKKTDNTTAKTTKTAKATETSDKSKTAKPKETPAPAQTPQPKADPNSGYVVLDDWGVRFKPSAGDTFTFEKVPGLDAYDFRTQRQTDLGGDYVKRNKDGTYMCKFHRLIRYAAGTVDSARKPGIVGSINGYDYLHMTPQAACGKTTAEQQVEVAENFKVNALLKTIEAKQ